MSNHLNQRHRLRYALFGFFHGYPVTDYRNNRGLVFPKLSVRDMVLQTLRLSNFFHPATENNQNIFGLEEENQVRILEFPQIAQKIFENPY